MWELYDVVLTPATLKLTGYLSAKLGNIFLKKNSCEFAVCLSVHRSISVEKKTNWMLLNALLHLQSAQYVSGT